MPTPGYFRNLLLSALPPDDRAVLSPSLTLVSLPRRTQLEMPNKKIGHLYFMESGIVSIVAATAPGVQVEVGIIGREGMTGLPVILGNDRMPYSAYIQVEGTGYRIEAAIVHALMARSEECRRIFLAFAQSFMIQMAETAIANARATIEDRLARWLLMAHDRVESDEIPLTHEFLALMMGARRPGVTVAMHELAVRGMVAGERGRITILDRAALQAQAQGHYGVPEKELARLFGREHPTTKILPLSGQTA